MGIERAFAVIVPIDLASIFDRFGPIPGVAGTRDQSGLWDHPGASRTVLLTDGSEAREQLTAFDAPNHFAYRVGPFTGPLRHLVRQANGAWWFTATGPTTTHIHWTYTFQGSPWATPLIRLLLAPLWSRYAQRALANAIAQAEAEA